MGLCVRKLDLLETVYESYDKYSTLFNKRTSKEKESKLIRYKITSGDTVGLFEYSERVQ